MNRTKTITLELLLAGDGLSGRASDGAGEPREFSGRLGLMHTIDELLEREVAMNPNTTTEGAADAARLRGLISGRVLSPDDAGWDAARGAFNVNAEQRPALIAEPRDAEEVAAVVRFAAEAGLRVAPQRTGHNAMPLGSLQRSVLLRTTLLDSVEIDVEARRATVGSGVRWEEVLPAASEHGLAALHGSTPDVSVAGYSLGGGIGWYGRKHGLAANSVTAIELVTADGQLRRVDAGNEPELFWALRGGGGNFGVLTALELDLYPVPELYAGTLFFPFERGEEVLQAWLAWTADVPEELTSVGRLLRFPPFEEIPEPVRGKSFALVEAAFLGGEADGRALLEPLRALGPAIDSFAMVPPLGIAELHMDPRDPMPYETGHTLLGELPPAAIADLVGAAGAGSGSALASVELRHTGGALGRPEPGHGALAAMPGGFASFSIGLAADPETTAKTEADLARVEAALRPYEAGRYFNFVEHRSDAASFFEAETAERLRAAKRAYDPAGLFQANHEIGTGQ